MVKSNFHIGECCQQYNIYLSVNTDRMLWNTFSGVEHAFFIALIVIGTHPILPGTYTTLSSMYSQVLLSSVYSQVLCTYCSADAYPRCCWQRLRVPWHTECFTMHDCSVITRLSDRMKVESLVNEAGMTAATQMSANGQGNIRNAKLQLRAVGVGYVHT